MASPHLAVDAGLYPTPQVIDRTEGAVLRDSSDWSPRATLPPIAAGQLWLVEVPGGPAQDIRPAAALRPEECRLIAAANVVVYDRTLAALVAGALPLGGYAEPAGSSGSLDDPEAIERCRRFAQDGWSVLRLAESGRTGLGGSAIGRAFASRLRADGTDSNVPVEVLVAAPGRGYRSATIALARLGAADIPVQAGGRVITIFPALRAGTAPALAAVAANGLAG